MGKQIEKAYVVCEFSQRVTQALRDLDVEAYSCDLKPTLGRPEWHFQCSLFDLDYHGVDLVIAHPDCRYLAASGARWWAERYQEQQDAIAFVAAIWSLPVKHIAIENPIGKLSTAWRKPDQIIQPWQFGEDASKATCLWLKNLPKLVPTNVLPPSHGKYYANQTPSGQNKLPPSDHRAEDRSITYWGIARAMAEQWSKL